MALGTIPTSEDFTALDERMQWYVDQEILSCIATLVMDGTDLIHGRRHGFLSVEGRVPLPEDAIFRIYSNSKLVTSTGLMMLCEEGRFELDDPLAEYLPQFTDLEVLEGGADAIDAVEPLREPIRIRHLLSHSAGLSYGFIEPESVIDRAYMAAGVNPLVGSHTLETLCDQLAELPLCYQPGESWRYSFATDVCARLVEVLSGQAFDGFLRERLFDPLGMVDTDFWVPEEKRSRFTAMYAPADFFDPMKPGFHLADDPITGTYTQRPAFLSGGGGLVSTMSDYATFIRMIAAGGSWDGQTFLQPETLEMMRTNQLAQGVGVQFPMWEMPKTVFGLGFALRTGPTTDETDAVVGEYYWGGMAGTHSWLSPGTGLVGLCFTQRMPGFWHPFSHDFRRLVYETRR